jgi:hypothetical protein
LTPGRNREPLTLPAVNSNIRPEVRMAIFLDAPTNKHVSRIYNIEDYEEKGAVVLGEASAASRTCEVIYYAFLIIVFENRSLIKFCLTLQL